jgi:hypothetical protein
MSLPPVVERELRVAFRKQQPVKRRFNLAAGAAGATVFLPLLGLTKTLHWLLFLFGLVIVLRSLQVTASLFSEERRNQTLELLFLTGMTAPQLFITKLIGGLLIASSDLLTIMPFLSIPFLAGVSPCNSLSPRSWRCRRCCSLWSRSASSPRLSVTKMAWRCCWEQ